MRNNLPPMTLNGWHRYEIVIEVLKSLHNVSKVLEIGIGKGAMGIRLAQSYDYTGVEMDSKSFAEAQNTFSNCIEGRLLYGDINMMNDVKDFDLLCAFEVLEHIEDDLSALKLWREKVNSKGYILFSVPARMSKFSHWDVKAGHFRRYERDELINKLKAAGLKNIMIYSYGFPLINVTEKYRNYLAKKEADSSNYLSKTKKSGRLLQPQTNSGEILNLLSLPFRKLQKIFYKSNLGTGYVVIAKKD